MFWYKVQVSEHGVQSVERVSKRGGKTARVFYVEAEDSTKAAELGKKLFRDYQRDLEADLRKRRRASGCCGACGHPRDNKGLSCTTCLEKDRRKYDKKRKGLAPMTRQEAIAAANAGREAAKLKARLDALTQVREALATHTRANFDEWLDNEITSLLRSINQRSAPSKKKVA